MTPSICIITPSYNQGSFIERTIRSVLHQDVTDVDYFVADGGSTDNTVAVLQSFGARIRWVSEKDGGQAEAVNKGIRNTTADIIGWLNSDDVYYPNALSIVRSYFACHPDCDLLYGNANHIDENDRVIEAYPTEQWNVERLREVCYLCQPAVFFRRTLVDRFGGLDASLQYCMDYEYWLRLSQKGIRIAHLPETLAGSRLHAATKTLGSRVKVHREINDMFRKCVGRVPERWLYNYAHTVADDHGIARTRRLRFALTLSAVSLYASLRWNRRLSGSVLQTTAQWVWQNLPAPNLNKFLAPTVASRQTSSLNTAPMQGDPSMRIGFDVSQTGPGRAGCGYFAHSLIHSLVDQAPEEMFLLYPTFGNFYYDPNWDNSTCRPSRSNCYRGLAHSTFDEAETFWLSPPDDYEDQLGQPHVIHSNNFFCPRFLEHARLVYTLYDLSFLENPDWTTEANRTICFEGVFQASLHADHLLAISHYSKRHFLEMFPHYPEDRISVTHLASRFDSAKVVTQPGDLSKLKPGRFWLCVGTLEPRKNHGRLLRAYAGFKKQRHSADPLVLAGGKGWLVDDLHRLIQELGIVNDVVITGYVNDDAMQWLYQNCYAALYPSLFEGFGLPVLEALSLGAPIITSNVTSIPEVAGDAALLVDPLSEQQISNAMIQLSTQAGLRAQLRQQGFAQAQQFRWDSAAQVALQCYEQVASMPPLRDVLGSSRNSEVVFSPVEV